MIKKTLRSLNQTFKIKSHTKELLLFATYRFMFEHADILTIIKELDQNHELRLFLKRLNNFSWDIALRDKNEFEILSINEACPSFFIDRLLPVMNYTFLKDNIQYMNRYTSQKTISLRVNTLSSKMSLQTLISAIKKDFKKKNLKIRQDKELGFIFHIPLNYKKKILLSDWYKNSEIIFQDKASAAIVQLLNPQPGEFICDLCGAPGIKSSLIAQLSEKQSKIICNDFNQERLKFFRDFNKKFSLSNMFLLNSDGTNFPINLDQKFDKILIDAPCTGSGTFLTNPELKWRQNQSFLHQNVLIQEKLLESGLKILKPNGIVVYSTCSLYPEEGELQIVKFKDKLEPSSIPKWFSNSYKLNNESLKGTGRLFPALHHTQGFFVGKFKKNEK